jgi:integrase
LGPKTIRLLNAILSGVFKWAEEDGLVGRRPTQGVVLPKKPRSRSSSALKEKEVQAFLKAARRDRYGLLFKVAIMSGLRPGELIGLRWQDVDLGRAQIEVSQGIGPRTGGGFRTTDLKTRESRRTIPIGSSLAAELKRHKVAQAEERLQAGDRWRDHDLVWPSRNGTPTSDKNLTNRYFKKVLKEAGLPPTVRIYDLRHYADSRIMPRRTVTRLPREDSELPHAA